MTTAHVSIEEASARLSDLIADLRAGGRVVITDRAQPVAELVVPRQRRKFDDLPESDEVDYETLMCDLAPSPHLTDAEIEAIKREFAASGTE